MRATGSELAEDIGHAKVGTEALVDTCEDVVDLLTASLVEDVEEVFLIVAADATTIVAEPIGIVAVDGAHQVVGVLVLRQLHASQFGRRAAGAVRIDQQVAVLVVPTCGTHGVDEVLQEFVERIIASGIGGVAPLTFRAENLVDGLEHQAVVVALEAVGNLRPQLLEAGADGGIFRLVGHEPVGTVATAGVILAGVVVHIEDAVASGIEHHIDHLLHAVHPRLLHIVVGIHMREPGHRHADDVETLGGDGIDNLGCGDRLSPAGLPVVDGLRVEPCLYLWIGDVVIGLERVAKVVAIAQLLDEGERTHERVVGVGARTFLLDVDGLGKRARLDGERGGTLATLVLGHLEFGVRPFVGVSIARMHHQFAPRIVGQLGRPVAIGIDTEHGISLADREREVAHGLRISIHFYFRRIARAQSGVDGGILHVGAGLETSHRQCEKQCPKYSVDFHNLLVFR